MAASAVLNGARTSSRIAEGTRERILEAATKLRYRPNATARALVNRRMNTIGVAAAIEDEREINSYALEVITGILAAAAKHDQSTTMFTLQGWDRDASRLHSWCDGRIDGLILIAPKLTKEAAKTLPHHTPFVTLHANHLMSNIVNIESDEERGAYEMVRFLISKGHRRIMHVSGNRGLTGAERRISGYRRALEEAKIPFSRNLFVPATFALGEGRTAFEQWLKANPGERLPDAIFCANDGIATGCLEVLAEIGVRVPEDISIAGFDDTLAARTTVPQLTTVRQPLREMGRRAVEVLLATIEHQNGAEAPVAENPIVFPVDLVPRASVGPPPAVARVIPHVR